MSVLSRCSREYVVHGLDDDARVLVKEHRWIVVIADDGGGVSSTRHKGEATRRVARVITRSVVAVPTSVLDQHVHRDRGTALRQSHVLELLQGISVHREAEEVKPSVERLWFEAVNVAVQEHRLGRADAN